MDALLTRIGASPSERTMLSEAFAPFPQDAAELPFKQLAALTASFIHLDFSYSFLAARILLEDLYATTPASFSEYAGGHSFLHADFAQRLTELTDLDELVYPAYDRLLTYMAMTKLKLQYLLEGERPQYMYLRLAVALAGREAPLLKVSSLYHRLASQAISCASPIMYHAGTLLNTQSSCFLYGGVEDSLTSILGANCDFGRVMRGGGGLGTNISRIRPAGEPVRGTNGQANGLAPLLKIYDATAKMVDQGANHRPGVNNVTIEPWHPEFQRVIGMRAPGRQEEFRLFNIHLTAYLPDIFMRRVEADLEALRTDGPPVMWSFMAPNRVPRLVETWGAEFESIYQTAEAAGLQSSQVRASEVMKDLVYYQSWSGEPCTVFKDTVNRHSNQAHMGTLTNLNLCVEIALFCSADYTAVCNISSICVPRYLRPEGLAAFRGAANLEEQRAILFGGATLFDWESFYEDIRLTVALLNEVIDTTTYPLETARRASLELRPIGIGIQGLADLFLATGLAYGEPLALELDRAIYASLYWISLQKSNLLAVTQGPYERWAECPWAETGQLHPDGYGLEHGAFEIPLRNSEWHRKLRTRIATHGLRNSQLVAQMPTASTAHLTGNTESFEPLQTLVGLDREVAGNFISVNRNAMAILAEAGFAGPDFIRDLQAHNGSVQAMAGVPARVKHLLRTAYEIPQRDYLDHAIARQPFVDQSQSLNVFFASDANAKLPSLLFYAWRNQLKTGTYYVRSKGASDAVKFTVGATAPEAACPAECTSCSG